MLLRMTVKNIEWRISNGRDDGWQFVVGRKTYRGSAVVKTMAGQVSQINADFWGVEAGYPVAGEKA